MDVLGIIFGVAVVGFILFWFLIGAGIAGVAIFVSFPILIGLVCGTWLWIEGHDNIGVLVGVVGLIGQIVWANRLEKGGGAIYNPMSGKAKDYDKSGNVIGYHDKD